MNTVELLNAEFLKRKRKNARYSLRSFARDLSISPTSLSLVLQRKRRLSLKSFKKCVSKLSLSEEQIKKVSIDDKYPVKFVEINLEQYKLISKWYCLAILSLADLKTNSSDPKWVAKRLNIDVDTARRALETLTRLGLVKVTEGKMSTVALNTTTPTDIPNAALREHQHDNLSLAKKSLEKHPIDLRDMTSVTFSTNPKYIKVAKQFIRDFRRKFCQKFETTQGREVYTLAVQLFPLTEVTDKT